MMTSEQIDRAVTALERIATALEAFVPEQETEEPGCPHPEASRLLLGQGPAFRCEDCQTVVMP